MNRNLRLLLPAILTALAIEASPARACSCLEYLTEPAEQLEGSGLVFIGTVTSASFVDLPVLVYFERNGELVPSQTMERRAVVTLRVEREWKGDGAPSYTILAGARDPSLPPGAVVIDCDEHLEMGKEYLIFSTERYPEASSCARTGLATERSEAIRALDEFVANRKRNAG